MTKGDKKQLSKRELDVVRLHLDGYSVREIADRLTKKYVADGGKPFLFQNVHKVLQRPHVAKVVEAAKRDALAVERARIRAKTTKMLRRIEDGALARGTIEIDPQSGRRYYLQSADDLTPTQLKALDWLFEFSGAKEQAVAENSARDDLDSRVRAALAKAKA